MSFSKNNRPNPLNDDELSDLTKKEILYWSHKLELTPSELFALSASDLEQHLNYAYSDALREDSQHAPMNSREWKEFSDMKRRIRESRYDDRLKGGETTTYQNIWAILAQAAIEIDKLCTGGDIDKDQPAKKNFQNSVRNLSSSTSREALQSFARSNSMPRQSSYRLDAQQMQRRASLPKKGHSPRYLVAGQKQPQYATTFSPYPQQGSPDEYDNSYNSEYESIIQNVFGSPIPKKDQNASSQHVYPLPERQQAHSGYSHVPQQMKQQYYRSSIPRSSNHGMASQLRQIINQTYNAPATDSDEVCECTYRYENVPLIQQQSRESISRANPAMHSSNLSSMHANTLRHQSSPYKMRGSNLSPSQSRKSMPRRSSSEEYNCSPTPQKVATHPTAAQTKPETRSCPTSTAASPSGSCSRLPLHSCLKRSDSTGRRSSRSITFDPRFCPDSPPESKTTSQTCLKCSLQDSIGSSKRPPRSVGGQMQSTGRTYYDSPSESSGQQSFDQNLAISNARSSHPQSMSVLPSDDDGDGDGEKPLPGSVKNFTDYCFEASPDGCDENSSSITIEFLGNERKRVVAASQNNYIPGGDAEDCLQESVKPKSSPTGKSKRRTSYSSSYDSTE